MNGEMHQAICIVVAAKKALRDQTNISYIPMDYEHKIEFRFLPKKHLFKRNITTAANVTQWFEHCKKKQLQEVKFLCPMHVVNRNTLGFSNTSLCSILCFFDNCDVTYFTPDWQFDANQKAWNILYTEHEWLNPPRQKPHFESNVVSFKTVLHGIMDFAVRIDCDGFAKLFAKSLHILEGEDVHVRTGYEANAPELPLPYRHIFQASCIADVFGAMGSWNDSPSYMAHEKGLDSEYENLSKELLDNIRLAILYAVNEW